LTNQKKARNRSEKAVGYTNLIFQQKGSPSHFKISALTLRLLQLLTVENSKTKKCVRERERGLVTGKVQLNSSAADRPFPQELATRFLQCTE